MGEMLQRMVGKAVMGAIGLALWMGYYTFIDTSDYEYTEVATLPSVVFEGGGGTLDIDLSINQPGQLTTSFEQWNEAGDDEQSLGSHQPLEPGEHHFSVDVAEATYGYFEVGLPNATVGGKIRWEVRLDGETLTTEEIELEETLADNYAFFVQFEFDDLAQLRRYAQR